MITTEQREEKRKNRHRRIRKKISGTSQRPRLCIHRSLKNLFAQVIDDSTGVVITGQSTLNSDFKDKSGSNIEAAKALGSSFAGIVKSKGITKVSFDRGGYVYHGRVKAFADAAREAGLEF